MSKRIFVLGGAGNMGSECCRALLSYRDIEELVIGDVNLELTRKLAEDLNDSRVKVVKADVAKVEETAETVTGYDLLLNCTFHGFFSSAINIAVKAGINYADLISEPTDEQRKSVREAGITAVSGLGTSPGLSNILAKDAALSLDETDKIEISFTAFRTIAPSRGLLETVLWELAPGSEGRQYYLMGKFVKAKPFEGSKIVRFGEPVGEQVVYYVAHTETATLPKHIPGVKFVAVRGTWRPRIMQDLMVLNRYGLLDAVNIECKGASVNVYDFVTERIWKKCGGMLDDDLWTLFLNVEVTGTRQNKHVRRIYNVTHPVQWRDKAMAKLTGINAAIGAYMLVRGGIQTAGIVDPEEVYDPNVYLAELEKRKEVRIVREEHVED
ncbi:MAG: saccharopine dehydrogenase family protein [Candidatus Bathyarchaeia archaeon]